MLNKMTGALIVGACALALGNPGIVVGLALAFVYWTRTKD